MRSLYDILWSTDYSFSEKWKLYNASGQSYKMVSEPDPDCMDLLHLAVKSKDISLVRKVISIEKARNEKFDINIRDSSGWTPLHVATFFGLKDIIKLLYKTEHANLKALTEDGETPLKIATYELDHKICAYFVKHGEPVPEIKSWIINGVTRVDFYKKLEKYFTQKAAVHPVMSKYPYLIKELKGKIAQDWPHYKEFCAESEEWRTEGQYYPDKDSFDTVKFVGDVGIT